MKKKVRVYKDGGFVKNYYMCGGHTKLKQDGGTPAYGGFTEKKPENKTDQANFTQDSQLDNIPQKKTADFLKKLKSTSDAALLKEQLKVEKEYIKQMAQDGYSMQTTNIPEHLENSRYIRPGATSESYTKEDPNLSAWMGDYYRNQGDLKGLKTLGTGALSVFNRPDKWVMKDDQHNFFIDKIREGYTTPELEDFEVLGVDKNGRNRTLRYRAKGSQEYVGVPSDNTVTPSNIDMGEWTGVPGDPTSGLTEVPNIDYSQSVFHPDFMKSDEQKFTEQNPDFMKMLETFRFALGGNIPKYQTRGEVGYPSYDVFGDLTNPQMYGSDYMQDPNLFGSNPDLSTTHGSMDFIHNLNVDAAEATGTEAPTYDPLTPEAGDPNSFEELGEIELKKQNKFAQAMNESPYLASVLAQGALDTAAMIGNLDERAARERDIKERVSNVHRTFGTQAQDRGDYMVNVPGMGDFLKPDQHTRMGYNTKVAQQGAEIPVVTIPIPRTTPLAGVHKTYSDNTQTTTPYAPGFKDEPTSADYARWEAQEKEKMMNMVWDPVLNRMVPKPKYKPRTSTFLKQEGGQYEVDSELDLTEEEIEDLIARGYDLEYID